MFTGKHIIIACVNNLREFNLRLAVEMVENRKLSTLN